MKQSKEFIALCKKLEVDPEGIPEITSFEEACAATGDDPAKLPIVDGLSDRYQKRLVADHKLSVIADALRMKNGKKTIVDYKKTNSKYFAVFTVDKDASKPSGFGLSFHVCDLWCSISNVGVRLCFDDYNVAEYFGKQFIDLHEDHHLLT